MSKTLKLQLENSTFDFSVRQLVLAGYTGRNSDAVNAHIAELERQGVPAPVSVPTVYFVDSSWATVNSSIAEIGNCVSGEAEPALLFAGNRLDDALVSIGIDFTDREVERRSIPLSKPLPKPLSARVWRYQVLAPVWDETILRSWVAPDTVSEFYQSGRLQELLSPRELLERLRPTLGDALEGTVLLMGTLPLLVPAFSFSDFFACELEKPDHSKLEYQCWIQRSMPAAGAKA